VDTQQGKWYLFAYCQNEDCGLSWAFLETPSPPAPVEVPKDLELTCPHCGRAGAYDAEEVVRGQVE
jgi:hypothetical protein